MRQVDSTGGGDAPECYELVLWEARQLSWRENSTRAFVPIGDDVPHPPNYALNDKNLDWEQELEALQEMRVQIFGVHAMAHYRQHARKFWRTLADRTSGRYLTLDQFNEVVAMLTAIAYYTSGQEEILDGLGQQLSSERRMTDSLANTFETLTGKRPEVNAAPVATPRRSSTSRARSRAATVSEEVSEDYGEVSLEPIPPGRFQRLEVDRDCSIREFVEENIGEGFFKPGAGYYEFSSKAVTVQAYKQVVLMDKDSGQLWSGDAARQLLGLPKGKECRLKPSDVDLGQYWVFIQSTSYNRKLLARTNFLYEVAEFVEAS